MNHNENSSIALVRATAKAFAERHRAAFEAVEQQNLPSLPLKILTECAELGWLCPLGDGTDGWDGNSEDGNGSVLAYAITDAAILTTLVFELGRVSPALGTRLLCHHYARLWLETAQQYDSERGDSPGEGFTRHGSENVPWLGVSAFDTVGARESHSDIPLTLERDRLAGKLTMVVAGPETTTVLCIAKRTEQEHALIRLERAHLPTPLKVATLGLHGLGVVDLELSANSNVPYNIVTVGPVVTMSRDRAHRTVLPAYVALCRAILTNCQKTAIAHADSRHQGGGLLSQLPEVREKLALIDRSLELSQLLERALMSGSATTSSLLVTMRQLLLQATDAGIQVLGGAGYVLGSGQERLWRDARQLAALFGPNLGLVGS